MFIALGGNITPFNNEHPVIILFRLTIFKNTNNGLNPVQHSNKTLYICDINPKEDTLKTFNYKDSHIVKRSKAASVRILLLLGCLTGMLSCAEQYNISGDSSVSTLDGRMLYLKAPSSKSVMQDIDSCEVVHGKFSFMGMVDSTIMGEIYMDNEGFMPIVIENGNISISISNTEQRVMGSLLNNRLYRFLEQKSRMEEEIINLSNQEAEMILSGMHPAVAHKKMAERTNKIYGALEDLEINFITTNSNNILGTTFFNILCSQYPYPIMTAQIEEIIKRSSPSFKKQSCVRNYIEAAEANMKMIQRASHK